MCVEIESMIEPPRQRPSHRQQPNCKSMPTLNMKSEADRRKTYKDWHVLFMDKNYLAAAGFYFTKCGDVVRCVFCGVDLGYLKEGDYAMQTISVGFQLVDSLWPLCRDVCGPFME